MDRKDRQILEILAQNCRIPTTTIAPAVALSKDAVSYRIRRLEKERYLKQYVLFIDARKLGFTRYHLLLRLKSDIEEKTQIYARVKEHPSVMWMNTFIGRFDMQLIVDAADSFDLNRIREDLFRLCRNNVKEYIILTHLHDLEFTQLNPDLDLGTRFGRKNDHSFSEALTTKSFPVGERFERYFPTRSETDILRLLADDPRASLNAIANELLLDRQTVKRKIARMIAKGIILNFGGIPDLSRFGYVTYYLLVRVAQDTPAETLRRPFEELRNIFYAGRMLGDYDMILYLNARSPEELNSSIDLFRRQIGKHIIHYDLLVQDKVHHWRQFTKGIHDRLRSVPNGDNIYKSPSEPVRQ